MTYLLAPARRDSPGTRCAETDRGCLDLGGGRADRRARASTRFLCPAHDELCPSWPRSETECRIAASNVLAPIGNRALTDIPDVPDHRDQLAPAPAGRLVVIETARLVVPGAAYPRKDELRESETSRSG